MLNKYCNSKSKSWFLDQPIIKFSLPFGTHGLSFSDAVICCLEEYGIFWNYLDNTFLNHKAICSGPHQKLISCYIMLLWGRARGRDYGLYCQAWPGRSTFCASSWESWCCCFLQSLQTSFGTGDNGHGKRGLRSSSGFPRNWLFQPTLKWSSSYTVL